MKNKVSRWQVLSHCAGCSKQMVSAGTVAKNEREMAPRTLSLTISPFGSPIGPTDNPLLVLNTYNVLMMLCRAQPTLDVKKRSPLDITVNDNRSTADWWQTVELLSKQVSFLRRATRTATIVWSAWWASEGIANQCYVLSDQWTSAGRDRSHHWWEQCTWQADQIGLRIKHESWSRSSSQWVPLHGSNLVCYSRIGSNRQTQLNELCMVSHSYTVVCAAR
jgi:hypothetical protein